MCYSFAFSPSLLLDTLPYIYAVTSEWLGGTNLTTNVVKLEGGDLLSSCWGQPSAPLSVYTSTSTLHFSQKGSLVGP